jgi:hypothetical protein
MNIDELVTTVGKTDAGLASIDNKITASFVKEGKTSRTYIAGLDLIVPDPEKRKTICKKIKTDLGTNGVQVTGESGRTSYGFNGNHAKSIKRILIKNFSIPESKIDIPE